jgi:hypothetical protein
MIAGSDHVKRVLRDDSVAVWGINGYAFADLTIGWFRFKPIILAVFLLPRKPLNFSCQLSPGRQHKEAMIRHTNRSSVSFSCIPNNPKDS